MIKYILFLGLLLLVACTATPAVSTDNQTVDVIVPNDSIDVQEPVNATTDIVADNETTDFEDTNPQIDLSNDPPIASWCVKGHSFTYSPEKDVVDQGYIKNATVYKGLTLCQAEAFRLDDQSINSTYYFSYNGNYMYVIVKTAEGTEEIFIEK